MSMVSATEGMGKVATTFYKRLASMSSEKRNTEYSQTGLNFSLPRASIISIRGARSLRHHAASEASSL